VFEGVQEKEISKESIKTVAPINQQELGEVETRILDILDEFVKPAVESDGGNIRFMSYEEGVVSVLLQGACSGCPSSTVTLKQGIENLLKKMLPTLVKEVVAING
jgi:Fe-S cluster biogenesis protein NfuA